MFKDYIEIFNNYALLEYNSQYSVIDAAIYLSKEEENLLATNATKFIIFTYTQILANLYSDQGLSIYNKNGKKKFYFLNLDDSANYVNENKLFLYNLIYLYDMWYENNETINEDSVNLYYTSSFNDVISKYINFCQYNDEAEARYHMDYLDDYINDTYMDSNILLEHDIEEIEVNDWKIDLYVCIYYYIDLINYANTKGGEINLLIVKIFLNVSIIYHYLDKFLNSEEEYCDNISEYLTNASNNFESNIVDEMMEAFYDRDGPKYRIYYENGGRGFGYEHFEMLFNMYELDDFRGTDFFAIVKMLNRIIKGRLNGTRESIGHFLQTFNKKAPYNLNFFYERFLSAFGVDASNILDNIDDDILESLFSSYFNCFFWLSFNEHELDESLFKENYKNMINEINNVYKDLSLQYIVKEILYNRELEYDARYFFSNQINLFKKLSILRKTYYNEEETSEVSTLSTPEDKNKCDNDEFSWSEDGYDGNDHMDDYDPFNNHSGGQPGPFDDGVNEGVENYGDDDGDWNNQECLTIYLPNLTKLDEYLDEETDDYLLTIGHSTFGEETSPSISLI